MTVPNSGKLQVLQFLDSAISHVALGDDGASENVTATGLGNELFRKTVTDKTIDPVLNTITVENFIGAPEANGITVREFGLLDSPTAGNLFVIKNIPDQVKSASLEWLLNVVIEVQ